MLFLKLITSQTIYLKNFITFVIKQKHIKNALHHTVNILKNGSGGRDRTYDQLSNILSIDNKDLASKIGHGIVLLPL